MNTKDVLLMLAVSVAAYYVGGKLFPKPFVSAGRYVIPADGSTTKSVAASQCGDWAQCLSGWGSAWGNPSNGADGA